MAQKTRIKIVRRGERERAPQAVTPEVDKVAEADDSSREITSTVKGWVREFQHKRRAGLPGAGEGTAPARS